MYMSIYDCHFSINYMNMNDGSISHLLFNYNELASKLKNYNCEIVVIVIVIDR